MKTFKEEVEYRRERNRNYRFGGWKGLLIKIILLVFIFMLFKSCNKNNVANVFNFFNTKNVIN
jgi:hypothetical protein